MAKIPFDIKFRPQIESGEYKVETREGRPVRIVCWDKADDCEQHIVALVKYATTENMICVCEDGVYKGSWGHGYDLFLITPEPELTEFEIRLKEILFEHATTNTSSEEKAREYAPELLSLAEKELLSKYKVSRNLYELAYGKGYENGKAEALKNIPNDEDMKAMLQLEYEKGRADVLKDMPRWEMIKDVDANGCYYVPCMSLVKEAWYKVISADTVTSARWYIPISDLEKLPGFKED